MSTISNTVSAFHLKCCSLDQHISYTSSRNIEVLKFVFYELLMSIKYKCTCVLSSPLSSSHR